MRSLALTACLTIAGCTEAPANRADVDLNAAAAAAEGDIAHYAASRHRRAAAPVDPGSPAAARAVVEHYYAWVAARRYAAAWRSWGHGGGDCGRSAEAFAAALAPLTGLAASVGDPRDADAGAGQRYITVPATLRPALHGGAPGEASATLVLHRVADGIDSDDPDAHQWRIASETLTGPMPAGCVAKAG